MKNSINKNHVLFVLGGLILILMLILGCAALQQIAKVQEPKLDVQNVRFTGMSFEDIDLAFDIKIKNPNPLSVTLAALDYDFQINNASFLKGQQDKQIAIQANGESLVEIPLTLNFNDLYKTYQALKNQDSSAYKLMCGLSFNLPVLGATRIPVSKSGSLPNIKLPDVTIGSLKLNKISLSGADLDLKLNVKNANTFSLLLNKLNYDFTVNGKTWVKGLSQKQMQVKEKGESILTIPISLNFLEMGTAIYQLINSNQKLNYQFKGDLDLNTSLPLLKQVSLPLERVGEINISR